MIGTGECDEKVMSKLWQKSDSPSIVKLRNFSYGQLIYMFCPIVPDGMSKRGSTLNSDSCRMAIMWLWMSAVSKQRFNSNIFSYPRLLVLIICISKNAIFLLQEKTLIFHIHEIPFRVLFIHFAYSK